MCNLFLKIVISFSRSHTEYGNEQKALVRIAQALGTKTQAIVTNVQAFITNA